MMLTLNLLSRVSRGPAMKILNAVRMQMAGSSRKGSPLIRLKSHELRFQDGSNQIAARQDTHEFPFLGDGNSQNMMLL